MCGLHPYNPAQTVPFTPTVYVCGLERAPRPAQLLLLLSKLEHGLGVARGGGGMHRRQPLCTRLCSTLCRLVVGPVSCTHALAHGCLVGRQGFQVAEVRTCGRRQAADTAGGRADVAQRCTRSAGGCGASERQHAGREQKGRPGLHPVRSGPPSDRLHLKSLATPSRVHLAMNQARLCTHPVGREGTER